MKSIRAISLNPAKAMGLGRLPPHKRKRNTAAPALRQLELKILTALHESTTDFRTTSSLAEQFDLPSTVIREAADRLVTLNLARHPYSTAKPEYRDWYAPASKPLTWQERYLRFKALLGREPI